MLLDTKRFGQIEIDENGILEFPEGIPGFEDIKRFVLLGSSDESSLFQWLQAVDNTELAFVVVEPKRIWPDYEVDVDEDDVKMLEIDNESKVLVFSIVVVPEDVEKMTANLKAPILINTSNKKGKQIIMDNSRYDIKSYIMEGVRKSKGGE